MHRVRDTIMMSLPLALIASIAPMVSAVILLVVIQLLTLFPVVGLAFAFYADVHVVPKPADDVLACDVVISILDERGVALDTRAVQVATGEVFSLRYRSRAGPGASEPIRATIKSRTVPPSPLPPGPCPILASLQVVDGTTGRTEALIMPAVQEVVRETIPAR